MDALNKLKTIFIRGEKSNFNNTTLANNICKLIPNAVNIKIGNSLLKKNKLTNQYSSDIPFAQIIKNYNFGQYFIIESEKIPSEIKPDCIISLENTLSKHLSIEKQDSRILISGTRIKEEAITFLSHQLELSETVVRKIVWLSGARPLHTTAVILAGGKSSRMGKDKAQLEINGEKILNRLKNQLSPFFDEIILSSNEQRKAFKTDLRVAYDTKIGQGPLMGIYSALQESHSQINFVIACDIPNVNLSLVFQLLASSEENDIVVPSFKKGRCEPLFAVYKKSVAPIAKKTLDLKKRRIIAMFPKCKVGTLPLENKSWYVNLNTPDDYKTFCKTIQEVK